MTRSATIYEVGLITIGLSWFLNRSGVFPRLVPKVVVSGVDYGFYLTHILLFLVVWLAIYFVERNLGTSPWLERARSNQGTAKVVDVIIIFGCLYCLAFAYGTDILWQSPYLIMISIMAFFAASQSLLLGRERYRQQVPPAGAAESHDNPQEPMEISALEDELLEDDLAG